MKRSRILLRLLGCIAMLPAAAASATEPAAPPYLHVLGIGQDGGKPQLGRERDPAWANPALRQTATSLALVDPDTGRRFLFEATPDLREQMYALEQSAPRRKGSPYLDGIFLTHAHMGHYVGLMFLGHESMGATGIPVFALPRMAEYLSTSGPWSQLVRYGNIDLRELAADDAVDLGHGLSVTPFLVPHRQEYSEVVGYRIEGACGSAVFIPDIDAWEPLDARGTRLEDLVAAHDHVLIDATFWADGEIPGRDMSGFPHPRIRDTMDRLTPLAAELRNRVRFIHLNHTNPALDPGSPEHREILERGFHVAAVGENLPLGSCQHAD